MVRNKSAIRKENMPQFTIETIEHWEYEVHYQVDAADAEEALRKVLAGDAEYDEKELRERSPKQEIHRIMSVTGEDGESLICSAQRLRAILNKLGFAKRHRARTTVKRRGK
jgi:hypothetical protein